MKKLVLSFSIFLLFTLFGVFKTAPVYAISFDIQILSLSSFNVLITEVEDVEGRVYRVRRENDGEPEITFGDGVPGASLPAGSGPTIGTYRYGSGDTGSILNAYDFSADFSSFLIPTIAFPVDGKGKPEYTFVLLGIKTLGFEISDSGMLITKAEFLSNPVPEPATLLLLGSGFVGLVVLRKKFKN